MSHKILIVDDSATIRAQLRSTLLPEGFDVIEAVDGVDGYQKAHNQDGLSMMICDVNMPRMNGIELVTKLSEQGNQVPIIMLTTEGQPSLIQQAKKAGVKGWIVKPFTPSLLVKAVAKLAQK